MTEHKAVCRARSGDYVSAHSDGDELVLTGHRCDAFAMDACVTPADARTFARGILALADEIDGGETTADDSAAQDVKAGDRVEITSSAGYAKMGAVGRLVQIDDDHLPYHVKEDDGGYVWFAAEVRKVDDAPAPSVAPRTRSPH
ncbi:hypothetical protein GCM10009548_02350 [Streptomyces malaysiensis subsp. malaysiensis]|uniref:Uncharacterized protein n=1 Tax=Streptomyces malaysiensis TaxID=92644 RepID=A0ABX6W4B6_STRMQ|nr:MULTISPECIES: hypothetical protein [Streptomyces]QPI56307.1 hypothetical protein I1A49_16390 [Streptomyces solisilvae]UHH17791.1 hypothetical protein LUV23_16510 [Streptomyces sp. HNM0561]